MNKRMIGMIVAALATFAGVLVMAPANANPGTPNCLTRVEWSRIHKGMTKVQVDRIAGFHGRLDDYTLWGGGDKSTWYNYTQCNRYGKPASRWNYVFIQFDNYKYDYNYNSYRVAPFVNYKGSWSMV